MVWAVQSGVQFPVETRDFSSPKHPNTEAQPAHYSMGIGVPSLGNKPDRK